MKREFIHSLQYNKSYKIQILIWTVFENLIRIKKYFFKINIEMLFFISIQQELRQECNINVKKMKVLVKNNLSWVMTK